MFSNVYNILIKNFIYELDLVVSKNIEIKLLFPH